MTIQLSDLKIWFGGPRLRESMKANLGKNSLTCWGGTQEGEIALESVISAFSASPSPR